MWLAGVPYALAAPLPWVKKWIRATVTISGRSAGCPHLVFLAPWTPSVSPLGVESLHGRLYSHR